MLLENLSADVLTNHSERFIHKCMGEIKRIGFERVDNFNAIGTKYLRALANEHYSVIK